MGIIKKMYDFSKSKVMERIYPQKEKYKEPETISVIMMDGTIDKYPIGFVITDRKHGIVDEKMDRYHTNFACKYLDRKSTIKGVKVIDAELKGIYKCDYCEECDRANEEWEKEIEKEYGFDDNEKDDDI